MKERVKGNMKHLGYFLAHVQKHCLICCSLGEHIILEKCPQHMYAHTKFGQYLVHAGHNEPSQGR